MVNLVVKRDEIRVLFCKISQKWRVDGMNVFDNDNESQGNSYSCHDVVTVLLAHSSALGTMHGSKEQQYLLIHIILASEIRAFGRYFFVSDHSEDNPMHHTHNPCKLWELLIYTCKFEDGMYYNLYNRALSIYSIKAFMPWLSPTRFPSLASLDKTVCEYCFNGQLLLVAIVGWQCYCRVPAFVPHLKWRSWD